MTNPNKSALLAALFIPGVALAQINVGDALGSSETAILAALQAQGYETTEIEVEDGQIEIDAKLNDQSFEIEVSSTTGLVLAVYEEDEIEDDDAKEDDD